MKSSIIAFLGVVLALAAQPVAQAGPVTGQESPTAGSAGEVVRVLRPGQLDRGHNARIATLQDDRLRPGDGSGAFRVDVPHRPGRLHLLGRSGGDWLVAAEATSRGRVYRVRKGRSPQVVPRTRWRVAPGVHTGWALSRDGRRLVKSRWFDLSARQVVHDAVSGDVVARADLQDWWALPLDADSGSVLTRLSVWSEAYEEFTSDIYEWRPGQERRLVAEDTNAGFIARDLIFVDTDYTNTYGPTSLAAPGTPAWVAPFRAVDVSPDGTLVLGLASQPVDGRRVLEVRRMSDGELLDAVAFDPSTPSGGRDDETARFESNRAFVLELAHKGGSLLVRCTLAGRCTRASDRGGPVTVPYEQYVDGT
ncbi:MAG: hypothetical protein ACI379_08800 [Nocardioides sp.]|uniref:hypothetical protein n=1 Tax=Nocardioides sp. TaxID=35761 RepID=UPI003F0E729F